MFTMNSNKIGNQTYQALKYLFLNSKDMQDEAKKLGWERDNLSYAKEFCTIKLTTARRSGHSTAIAKLVNEYHDHKWSLLGYNLAMAERNLNLIRQYDKGFISKATKSYVEFQSGGKVDFMSLQNFENNLRGIEFDGIIVDCACMMSQNKMERLYDSAIPCMQFRPYMFFIFVE